jgi:NAD-specific glutamate dehydrogenase
MHRRYSALSAWHFALTRVSRSDGSQIIESPLSLPYAVAIADLFMRRFDPTNPLSNAAFAAEATPLAKAMQRSSSDQRQLALLTGMLEAVEAVKRTNLYLPKRYGLAMRLDPSHLGHGTVGSDMPYGAFCVQQPINPLP